MLFRSTALSRNDIKSAVASLTIGSGSAAAVLVDRHLSRTGNRLLGGVARANTQFCHLCHNEIHTLPVPVKKQRAIAGKRGFYIRRDLRRVLGYRPAPYCAPDSIDLAQVYEEYLGRCPQGSYRMSG